MDSHRVSKSDLFELQLKAWHVTDNDIIELLSQIPRARFVPNQYVPFAMSDIPIPLPGGQEILTVRGIAKLLQAAALQPTDVVLEIGTITGYTTALLAKLAKQVESVDPNPAFTQKAAEKLVSIGINNVTFFTGQALSGWGDSFSYDVIWVNGALLELPSVKTQLSIGGRLCAIIGRGPVMEATMIKRVDYEQWDKVVLFETETKPNAELKISSKEEKRFIF